MKTKILWSVMLTLMVSTAFAQRRLAVRDPQNHAIRQLAHRVTANGSLHFRPGLTDSPETFLETHKLDLGLTEADQLVLTREDADEQGNPFYRFAQYHNGLLVEGAEYILYTSEGQLSRLKGRGAETLTVDTTARIQEDLGLESALRAIDADIYSFDNANHQHSKNTPDADPYPRGLKVLVRDPNSSEHDPVYLLAYRFQIKSIAPYGNWLVYIDAKNGDVILRLSQYHSAINVTGSVNTAYNGNQSLVHRKRQFPYNDYILKDKTRGEIAVKQYADVSFLGWNLAGHIDQGSSSWNGIEASLLWTAQQAHDYFYNAHNRNGVDGSAEEIRILAGSGSTGYDRDNGKSYITAVNHQGAAVDVMAHEFTHGVVRHSSGLVYAWESGALNESFADIFGTMAERDVVGDANYDWLLGGDFGAVRDMANPNVFQQPDTRGGLFWFNPAGCIPDRDLNDYCGVHINSGVQNRWFQLLVDGGNQNGVMVTAIGEEAARNIAYRNMTVELFANADFDDAREGAIDAAESLYGICSNEVQQVRNAWAAVGVGAQAGICIPPLVASINGPPTVNKNEYNNYSASIISGVPPYTYSWSATGLLTSNSNPSTSVSFPFVGTNTIQLTITDSEGQSEIVSREIFTVDPNCLCFPGVD